MKHAVLLLASQACPCVFGGELVLLQQLTRHGVRSPKSSYSKYCPKDPWTYSWTAWNADLTGVGMLEETAVGKVTRTRYGDFLGTYNGTKHIVRAVDSDRVLQSAATAMFFGNVFPPGTGPKGGLPGRPTIVPVHSVKESKDDLLAVDGASCEDRSDADYDVWWSSTGESILAGAQSVVAPIAAFCGRNATSNKVRCSPSRISGPAWRSSHLTPNPRFSRCKSMG